MAKTTSSTFLARAAAALTIALAPALGSWSACLAATTDPSWGAIASTGRWYGFSFNHGSRAAAERAARAQCNQSAGRSGPCEVRAYFDRACGALAEGNYGEWATALAPTPNAAGKAAVAQCDAHLPTEPCKLVVSVCSPR